MAVATTEELRRWLRRTEAFSEEETAQAELFLDLAQGTIEDEAGQELDTATDTVTLDGPGRSDGGSTDSGTHRLVLPRWPVTAVASVTLLDPDGDQELTYGADEDFTWSQDGILTRVGGCWPAGDQVVQVVYTAGFSAWPKGLKRIGLRLAGAAWDNPAGLTAESLGDHSRQFNAETLGMELSKADLRAIGAYRART